MIWTNIWLFFIFITLGFIALCIYAIGDKISEISEVMSEKQNKK